MGDIQLLGKNDEIPMHEVELDGFIIRCCPVAFSEYEQFCTTTNREKPDDNGWGRGHRSVIKVSWQDANEYCQWLSKKPSLSTVFLPKPNGNMPAGPEEALHIVLVMTKNILMTMLGILKILIVRHIQLVKKEK